MSYTFERIENKGIIFNGDCLEIMPELIKQGIKVDLCCSDPPYEVCNRGQNKVPESLLRQRILKNMGSIDFIAKNFDYEQVFKQILDLCSIPNILLFASHQQLGKTLTYFEERNLKTDCLIWSKTNPSPLCNMKYVSDLEYIVFAFSKGRHWNNYVPYKNKLKCKRYAIMTNKNKKHPTEKPLKLMEELINLHSLEGDLVIDPFMGSGTTLVACRNLNRKFIGIEKEEKYYNIAKKRIIGELP